jgi:hypothetical protein
MLIGTASTTAAVAGLPAAASALETTEPTAAFWELWPGDTPEERGALIVRCMQERIAHERGISEKDVTIDELYERVCRFGFASRDEVANTVRLIDHQDEEFAVGTLVKERVPIPGPWSIEEWVERAQRPVALA